MHIKKNLFLFFKDVSDGVQSCNLFTCVEFIGLSIQLKNYVCVRRKRADENSVQRHEIEV